MNIKQNIEIYTDGSCNHDYKIGGWASILIFDNNEVLLKGKELNTTHNRMELLSVIKAIQYLYENNLEQRKIIVVSDSQYLVGLIGRKEKLKAAGFITKQGKSIQNSDLVKTIIHYIDILNVDFVKIKAHQRKTDIRNINRDVDKISRKIVRDYVKNNF